MKTAEEIAKGLAKASRSGNQWRACCPAHDDKNPSLSIMEKDGKTLVHCFAGCSQGNVISALRERGLWHHPLPRIKTQPGHPVSTSTMQILQSVNEISVGEEYAISRKDKLRYDHELGCWCCWNNYHWERDVTEWTRYDASEYVAKIAFSNTEKKPSMSFVDAVLKRARCEREIAISSNLWDQDDWLLGTLYSTFDLRTGQGVKNDPKHHISKWTSVDPCGDCPRWQLFIGEIAQNDPELMRYLQKLAGYCLTGSTKEQALFFLYGPGRNGKSVFVETIASVMGGYAITAPPETFAASGFDKHPTEIARMAGARLVYASETEEGRRWNASRIKQLTGGDRVSARFMRQDFFEFKPRFKIIILGNHKPVLTNVTEAERRRLHVIPLTFVPSQPDPALSEKLHEEGSGILEWMIEGACLWNEEGLGKPPVVIKATEEYFADQDLFQQWLEDECRYEPDNDNLFEPAKELYRSWRDYAHAAGDEAGSKKSFGDRLRGANLRNEQKRINQQNTKIWMGVELNRVENVSFS